MEEFIGEEVGTDLWMQIFYPLCIVREKGQGREGGARFGWEERMGGSPACYVVG